VSHKCAVPIEPVCASSRLFNQLATVLPALAHGMHIAATVCAGKRMIALCRKAAHSYFLQMWAA
jgi:hypothetical protein